MSDSAVPPILTKAEQPLVDAENGSASAREMQSIFSKLGDKLTDIGDKFKEGLKDATAGIAEKGKTLSTDLATGLLGPLRLITEPLLGISGESIVSGIGKGFEGVKGLFSKDGKDGKEEKERIRPRRETLLKEGIEGAAAVYTADTIVKALGGADAAEEEGGGGGFLSTLTQSFLGPRGVMGGLMGGIRTFFSNPMNLVKVGGGLLFAGLTVKDFLEAGLPKFQEGDIIGGITDTLLGAVATTGEEVARNVGMQALKWGGFGLMIGGPVGAAIGAGAGALVAGIKGALELEWDESVSEVGDDVRGIWSDPEKGLGRRLLETTGQLGKSIVGVMAGGVREIADGVVGRVDNIRELWADEERGGFSKVMGTLAQSALGVAELSLNLGKGLVESARNLVLGLFPEEAREKLTAFGDTVKERVGEAWEGVKGFFSDVGSNIRDRVTGFISNVREEGFGQTMVEGARNIGERLRGFFDEGGVAGLFERVGERVFKKGSLARRLMRNSVGRIADLTSGISEGVGNFMDRVREEGLGRAAVGTVRDAAAKVGEFFTGAAESVKEFFGDIQEKGLGVAIEDKIAEATANMDGFFGDAARRVGAFFGDIQRDGLGSALRDLASDAAEGIKNFFVGFGEEIAAFGESVTEEGLGRGFGRLFRSEAQIDILEQIQEYVGGVEKYDELMSEYANFFGMAGEKRFLASEDFAKYASEAGVSSRDVDRAMNSIQSVNDAIITNDGQIIHVNPNDTLIATQNPIAQITDQSPIAQMTKQTVMTQTDQEAFMGDSYGSQIHEAILKLLDALQKKEFTAAVNNIQQSPPPFDVKQFRFRTVN